MLDKNKLTIAIYLANANDLSGAPSRMINLAKALNDIGVNTYALSAEGSELNPALQEKNIPTINIFSRFKIKTTKLSGISRKLFHTTNLLPLIIKGNIGCYRAIKSHSIEYVVVRAPLGVLCGGLGARLAGAKVICDFDYVASFDKALKMSCWLAVFMSSSVAGQYKNIPRDLGKFLGRYVEAKGFKAITPGIDVENLIPYRIQRENIAPAPSKELKILMGGTIHPRKRQDLLLDAVIRLGRKKPGTTIQVDICGSVKDENYAGKLRELQTAAPANVHIIFHGWQNNLAGFMVHAHILAVPSKDEGVPNVIQEAMVIGLPVIASPAGGVTDIVFDTHTGWVVTEDIVHAWVKKLEFIINNSGSYQGISKITPGFAAKNFRLDQWAAKYKKAILNNIKN